MALFIVVGVTSVAAYFIGVKWVGLSTSGLGAALGRLLECIGTGMVFTATNLAVAGGGILGIRIITGHFTSLYILDDVVWLVLSALQGFAWGLWRQRG